MAFICHYELNESEVLASNSLISGSLIYCKDSTNIYMVPTTGGKPVKMAETTKFLTEKERNSILAPINGKKYFCYDTGKMWIYYNQWICINPDITDKLVIEEKIIEMIISENVLPFVSTAEVGQTIRVSEVDENNKPAAWEPMTPVSIQLITWEELD